MPRFENLKNITGKPGTISTLSERKFNRSLSMQRKHKILRREPMQSNEGCHQYDFFKCFLNYVTYVT